MTSFDKRRGGPTATPKLVLAALLVLLVTGCGKFFRDANDLVSITVSPSNSTLQISRTQQYTAIGTFGDDSSRDISSSVTWSSSSGKVATIDSSGVVTTVGAGNTTIKATQGDISGSTNLNVSISGGGGLTVSPSSQTISIGQTVQFTATLNGSSVSGVSWSSSRTTVASIGQDGVATGTATGTTTIMASATVNGTQYQGTATLTVQ